MDAISICCTQITDSSPLRKNLHIGQTSVFQIMDINKNLPSSTSRVQWRPRELACLSAARKPSLIASSMGIDSLILTEWFLVFFFAFFFNGLMESASESKLVDIFFEFVLFYM